ncbi:MAG TPA: GNAT family N-acetyltransferase [Candidatus Tumulicola sp.]|nr:GNAT family N-acetyltransferase [Candidatus Tumulicola sp.]
MTDARLRLAKDGDAATIYDIVADAGQLSSGAPSSLDDLVQFLRGEHGGAFVATAGGADAGVALFARQGEVFWLVRLAVRERFRKRGIGAALVAAVEARARAEERTAVFVQAIKADAVIQYFEGLGYDIDREEPDVARGEPVVMVDLIKLL